MKYKELNWKEKEGLLTAKQGKFSAIAKYVEEIGKYYIKYHDGLTANFTAYKETKEESKYYIISKYYHYIELLEKDIADLQLIINKKKDILNKLKD